MPCGHGQFFPQPIDLSPYADLQVRSHFSPLSHAHAVTIARQVHGRANRTFSLLRRCLPLLPLDNLVSEARPELLAARPTPPPPTDEPRMPPTSKLEFAATLEDAGFAISVDGRGRCMDNIFIERLWRSRKHEAVYLHELSDGFQAQRVIARWLEFYNTQNITPAWMATPAEAYEKAIQRYRLSPTARLPLGRLRQTRKTCKRGLGQHDRSPGIHLISAASCPTNQEHLISPELPLQYLSLQNQRLHCNWTTSHRSSFLPQCRSSPECRNVLQF